MSSVIIRRLRNALLGLCACTSLAQACPQGQARVCMVSCFCVPGAAEDIAPYYESLSRVAARGLQTWLEQSRLAIAGERTHPIPPAIRERLAGYYDSDLLDRVRYQVGDEAQLSAANAMLQNPDVNAVTLVDVIVFRHEEEALHDVALWAHELKHVEQYREWGVEGFATRYIRGYTDVEAPAYGVQGQVARDLRGR